MFYCILTLLGQAKEHYYIDVIAILMLKCL